MTLLRTTNCVFFSNTNLMARHIFTQRRGFYAETTASLMSVWTLEQAATVDRLVLISAIYLRAIISKFSNPKEDEGWTGDQIPRTSNSLSSTRLSRKKRERGTGERAWESGGERERKKNCGRGRGRKSRRRERWADDKKAAPADVVTTVGVRGESCVPDAWGRDGGEVSWADPSDAMFDRWGVGSRRVIVIGPLLGLTASSEEVNGFGPFHNKRSEIISVKQTCGTGQDCRARASAYKSMTARDRQL